MRCFVIFVGLASSPSSLLCMSCVETGSCVSFFKSTELAIRGQRCITSIFNHSNSFYGQVAQ